MDFFAFFTFLAFLASFFFLTGYSFHLTPLCPKSSSRDGFNLEYIHLRARRNPSGMMAMGRPVAAKVEILPCNSSATFHPSSIHVEKTVHPQKVLEKSRHTKSVFPSTSNTSPTPPAGSLGHPTSSACHAMRQGPSLSQAPAAEAKRGDAAVQHDTPSMVAPGFRGKLGGKRCRIFS